MIVGIPKEVKAQEYRVALLPAGVIRLQAQGHQVLVERGAGAGAGFMDADFAAAGACLVDSAAAVHDQADVILKVKEPQPSELSLYRSGQTLFCYIHCETRPELTRMLLERRLTGLAYENVQSADGDRPLLRPMSVIAGHQSVLQGMQFLCNHRGGTGRSLVAYPGLSPAVVVVVGAGHAGQAAARVAAALGARVMLFEVDPERICRLGACLPAGVTLCHTGSVPLDEWVAQADLLIHTTTLPPHTPNKLIDRQVLRRMRPGSVIVDVTANLHGAIETVDRYTTHDDPVYVVDGIVHYVVSNIPGTVAHTASKALAMAVLPYLEALVNRGIREALRADEGLLAGLTCMDGVLTWHEAGELLGLPWSAPQEVLAG